MTDKKEKTRAKADAKAKAARAKADAAKKKADAAKRKEALAKVKAEAKAKAAPAILEAIATALGHDTELAGELEEARRRTGGKRSAALWLHTTDALAEAVEKKPSFLGRLAYGTAQLIGTLASEDVTSNKRLAEIAGGDHVGIVFIDVVGFTAYTAANGDEAAVELVKRLESMVSSICNLHDGEVVKHLGDGFLIAFGSASRATRGALALRDAAREEREKDPSFQAVRIVVHAGRPSVVRDDLIGHDVNLTARLLAYCPPGEVLATEEAKALAEKRSDSLRFSDAGTVEPRGLPEPVATFRAGV
jgi:class 3 adenylate cyclase